MERRSGVQRRSVFRLLKLNNNIGRRLEDLEFSVFLKMGLITAIILAACIISVFYVN